jgi:hypothetical protein
VSFIQEASLAFGDINNVLQLLTDADLEYLVTFPGFVVVVKAWYPTVELTDFGYRPGTVYTVMDNKLRYLYQRASSTGLFGDDDAEVEVLFNAQHGSFLHIHFYTDTGPTIGLLWICNQLESEKIKARIGQWVAERNSLLSFSLPNELFVSCRYLLPTDEVIIQFVPGAWTEPLSKDAIAASRDIQVSVHRGSDQTIYLQPFQSGWWSFLLVRDGVTAQLDLANLQGSGLLKVLRSKYDTWFINLSSSNTAQLPTSSSFPTASTAPKSSNLPLRVEADFVLSVPDKVTGKAVVSGRGYVNRKFTNASTTQGKTFISGRGDSSGRAQVVGRAVVFGRSSVSSPALVIGRAVTSAKGIVRAYGTGIITGRAIGYSTFIATDSFSAQVTGRAVVTGRSGSIQYFSTVITKVYSPHDVLEWMSHPMPDVMLSIEPLPLVEFGGPLYLGNNEYTVTTTKTTCTGKAVVQGNNS